MHWQAVHGRLLDSLRGELKKKWGRIREVEERLGLRTAGYLHKLCAGKVDFKLPFFLEAIDALGLDPQRFFARALELRTQPEDCLLAIEDEDERDHALRRILRAAEGFETVEDVEPAAVSRATSAGCYKVEDLAGCSCQEQLRRLRQTAAYRNQAFAQTYLEHLDAHRYDHAEESARLVTGVVVHLLPKLPIPRRERLELLCLALGVFGSARRLKGRFSAASRAFRAALELSRRARLQEETANLLIRASYLLRDHGHFGAALGVLNEALVLFVRLGSHEGMGRVLVDQGMMLTALGDYDAAVEDLEQALHHLADSVERLPRYCLAAYQYLAFAFEQQGKLETAERWLARGIEAVDCCGHSVDRAKLEWLRGNLALRRGDTRCSEECLRSAYATLAEHENLLQAAVVTIDLIQALMAQGKNAEATETAAGMGRLLWKFKNNRLAEAVVVELVSSAVAGHLNAELVHQARAKLCPGETGRTTS